MKPNRSKHEFYIAIEPHTGIPLDVRAQLQINMLLQPVRGFKLYEEVPELMVPMLWFTQRATLTTELANQAKMALMLPKLGIYVAIFFGTTGILLGGIFALNFRSHFTDMTLIITQIPRQMSLCDVFLTYVSLVIGFCSLHSDFTVK
ncbi:protein croquemort-like [Wyeomyia smithii]|uniref:protein croquemort-like n=1 Tax=Wyeomyia smithii TaxID=174621 RepID=UPI002467D5D8|nr:protein croquemort-like [Wyeomyia smithii]